jgi:hypothetical protein
VRRTCATVRPIESFAFAALEPPRFLCDRRRL